MQRGWLAAAALTLAACGGSKGLCGGSTCAEGQRCDLTDGVCVTNEPPKLALSTPSDQSEVTANPLPFSGTASDDEGPPKVEWSVDGTTWTAVELNDGTFAAAAALPPLDGAPMTFTVRATDRSGQVTTVHAGLSVDDVAPACDELSPMPLEVFKTGAVDVRFRASGYVSLELTLDDKSVTPAVAGDEVSYQWPVPTEDWVTHKIHLIATDAAANVCEIHRGFVVDDVPPVISIEQPTEGEVMGPDLFGIEFAFGVSKDGSLVTNTVVDVDDGNGFVQSGIWADHWVVGRDAPAAEDFVTHSIKVRATDLAGNVTEADETWIADVVPPRLTILSPSPGQKLNASNLDVVGRVAVSWMVADGDPRLAVVSPQSMGQVYMPPMSSFGLPTSPADNGTPYMAQLTAVTRTGQTTATVSFTVDRVPPFVVSASPSVGSRMVSPGSQASVLFNEPVNHSQASGTWSATDDSVVLTLPTEGDALLSWSDATTLTDFSGNPFDGGPIGYRTTPQYWSGDPDAGLLTVPGAVSLSAASNQESALVLAVTTNADMHWYAVDSRDGGIYAPFIGLMPRPDAIRVSSFLRHNATAEDPTWIGVEVKNPTGDRYSHLEDDHHLSSELLAWYVNQAPVAGQTADGTFSEINYSTLDYFYGSSSGVAVPLTDVTGISTSSTHWIGAQGGADTPWTAFGCDAGTCAFLQSGIFPDAVSAQPYAFSAGAHCDLFVYSSSVSDGGLALVGVPWTAGCPPTGCPAPAVTSLPGSYGGPLFNPADEVTFEILTTSGSTFSISTGTLDATCAPTLTPVSSFTVPQGLVDAKPVWMYGKPSALYLDSNGTVRLFVSP